MKTPTPVAAVGRWLKARFSTSRWTGLYLTLTLVVSGFFLRAFIVITSGVAEGSPIVAGDPGIDLLVAATRTPAGIRLNWMATLFGEAAVQTVLALIVVGLLMLWGKRAYAALAVGTLTTGLLLQTLIKVAIGRPRPPLSLMVIAQPSSYSYPSGHAMSSTLLLGIVAFIAVRVVRRRSAKVLIVALAAILGLTVGLSRVYLGVHWLSDVLAGWDLALALLALWIGGFLMWRRYGRIWPDAGTVLTDHAAEGLAVGVALLVAAVLAWSALSDPVLKRALVPAPTVALSSSPVVTQAEVARLPVFSVKLNGAHMEPIGIMFVGTRAQLTAAFERAGWSVADPATFVTIVHAFADGALDLPYPTAPVTPTLLGGHTQDVAFERPQGRPTVRVRHHTRWWQTGFTAGGEPIWVGTMSFDEGIAPSSAVLLLPTHRIAPDIDAERDLVVGQLLGTGRVSREPTVTVSVPLHGTNAQGDAWFGGGRASVLVAR
jgi:membrane-associated phospholipid phosphatase